MLLPTKATFTKTTYIYCKYMIKFFRRIRQQLIFENKTAKYLKYAIGEIKTCSDRNNILVVATKQMQHLVPLGTIYKCNVIENAIIYPVPKGTKTNLQTWSYQSYVQNGT